MNEETPVRCQHSPDVPLREYIERIFEEKQKALEIAFISQQKALDLATRNLELRLEKLNELRAEVSADRSEFVKFATYDAQHRSLEDKIDSLIETQIRNENKYVTVEKYKTEVTPLQDLRGKIVAVIAGSVALAAVIGYAFSMIFGRGGP